MSSDSLTPNMMVEDVGETVDWYERVMDAEVLGTMPPDADGELKWAQVSFGDVDLMFQERSSLKSELPYLKDQSIGGSVTFYIDVDDVDKLHQRIADGRDADVVLDIRETSYGRREFAVTDCNGYVLWFGEKIGAAGD